MSDFNQTPVPSHSATHPAKPTASGGTSPALSVDGHDTRQWWALNDAEKAERMERYNRLWWERYRRVVRWNEVLRACQKEAPL